MVTTLDKTQSRARIAELRAHWNEWDPIGVASSPEDDEYNAYLGPTLRLLEKGAPVEELAKYLEWVVHEQMGLSQLSRSPLEFAEKIQSWFAQKWSGTRVAGV